MPQSVRHLRVELELSTFEGDPFTGATLMAGLRDLPWVTFFGAVPLHPGLECIELALRWEGETGSSYWLETMIDYVRSKALPYIGTCIRIFSLYSSDQ